MDGKYECCIHALHEETICGTLPVVSKGAWTRILPQLGVTLSDISSDQEPISLLIAADIAGRFYTGKIHQLQNGPTLLQTKLGWTLMGTNDIKKTVNEDTTLIVFSMFCNQAKISDLWELDVLGISDPVTTLSKEAHLQSVKQCFQKTIKVNAENRYEVCLPWKVNRTPLCDNRWAAEKRLHGLTQKLIKDCLYDDYDKVFDDWLQEGVIEKVKTTVDNGKGYFLPHRHVVKWNSTTRIRPVFDASACSKNGPSLNQCLETGPNLIELVPSLLHRFRENKIGITADIAKAFLQIGVSPDDRDVLRFLWWSKSQPSEMIIYRHRRVVFGVSSSPFLLEATIEYHLEKAMESAETTSEIEFIEKLKKAFYVDNCLVSVTTMEEGLKFQQNSTAIMQQAGFNLRGWEFNGLNNDIETISILGISWNKRKDVLFININFSDNADDPVTKRKILSAAHRIFDPLGWVCPVMLLPKLLLRSLCNKHIEWDAEVPTDIESEFKRWHEQIPFLRDVNLPRWIFGERGDNVTFHMFVDASKQAYAAVLYVRVEGPHEVKVHLVQAKSRVGPTSEITIPRMELLAATLGARLMNSFSQATNLQKLETTFWSDSSTVLTWLKRGKQWSTFVFNRVEEIKSLTNVCSWRHVPGRLNPADLPSRGCSAQQLVQSKWWEGPDWLTRSPTEWPQENLIINEELVNFEISKGRKKSSAEPSTEPEVCLSVTCTNTVLDNKGPSWYLFNSSSYVRIIRIIAWILRFKSNVMASKDSRISIEKLSIQEFKLSEKMLMRLAQNEAFNGISDPRLKGLNVYLDDFGIIRTKTLISNRLDNHEFRCPVVLDAHHRLTTLFIEYTHRRLKHAGIGTTMTALRENVWIISSRRAVRSTISKCVICRKQAAKPLSVTTSNLPQNRVRDAAVFEVVGVVKDLLKKTLGRASLDYEEMTTVLCETEAVVNACPLTYVTDDFENLIAITPEMFLKEIHEDGVPDLDQLDKISLDRRLKYRQRLRQELRTRFRSEYLGRLSRHVKTNRVNCTIKAGDVVLINHTFKKRIDWPLAHVVRVIAGNDGVPRVVKLKTASGEIIRPIQRLILLESSPSVIDDSENDAKILNQKAVKIAQRVDKNANQTLDTRQQPSSKNSNLRLPENILTHQEKRTRSGRIIKIPKKLSQD